MSINFECTIRFECNTCITGSELEFILLPFLGNGPDHKLEIYIQVEINDKNKWVSQDILAEK